MAELGRLTAIFDADTRKFDAGVRGVAAKVSNLTNTFGGLRSGGSSAISTLSGLASPMALAAGGAVVAATAIGGTVAGLWKLVTSAAEAGGELHDLSQKTNFAVETLSGLSIVAQTTGSDIKGISNSLFIFQGNMVKAKDETSAMGKAFKELKVDTQDQERALRQAMKSLSEMGATEEQAAKAKLLFGKAGKDVLGIIKETNGDLDLAIAKYDKMGLIISTSAAAASDRFNDLLEETTLQLAGVTRTIGMELLPMATKALKDISSWLAANRGEWKQWGSTIASVVGEVVTHIGYIAKGLKSLMTLSPIEIQIIERVMRVEAVSQASKSSGALGTGVGALWWLATQSTGKRDVPVNWGGASGGAMGGRGGGVSGFGGGGGGGGGGSARQDPGVQLLKQLEEQFQGLIPKTEAQAAAEKILGKEFANTRDEIKRNIQVTAMEIDQRKMVMAITRERIVGLKAETEAIEKMIEMVREAGSQGLPFFSRQRTTMDLTGLLGTGATRSRSIADGATRERVATVDEQVARERLAMIREQMEGLASDLMGIFDRALYDGISGGGMRGLQSLTLGFLDMIQQVILGNLKKALAEALTTGASGGSGWLSKILGALVGVGLSAAGGGGAHGAGHALGLGFASGGFVPGTDRGLDSVPAMLRPGELVLNKQQQGRLGGTTVNNFNITVPRTHQTTRQRRTQRELAETIAGLLTA
ncbi:MAG: hypothetical protein AABN95_16125 [Acidobacteriota bacterium]